MPLAAEGHQPMYPQRRESVVRDGGVGGGGYGNVSKKVFSENGLERLKWAGFGWLFGLGVQARVQEVLEGLAQAGCPELSLRHLIPDHRMHSAVEFL